MNKIRAKNTSKNQENKKYFSTRVYRCGNHHNILPLFGGLKGYLTLSPHLSYIMKHAHTSQKTTIARGWERDG
jgi:hypothetical protein